MFHAAYVHVASRLSAAAAFFLILTISAFSQDQIAQRSSEPRPAAQGASSVRHAPGQFDFYVLALSWSPSYCESVRERAPDRVPQQQCSARPYSFVVHGLWPQAAI